MTAQKMADAIRDLIVEYETANGTMVQRVTASGRHGVLEVEIEERVVSSPPFTYSSDRVSQ